MSIALARTMPWCLSVALLLAGGTAPRAQGQEKPDAPTPKFDADPESSAVLDAGTFSLQGPAGSGAGSGTNLQHQERKKSYLERFLGFRTNLEPFEPPDNAPPLSVKQKYAYAFREAEDFKAHIGNVLQAAMQQGFDSQPHYGQGWGPYAQRYGAAEADQITSCFFIYGFLPHIAKTDPRYFRKKSGSVWSRMTYAANRTFVTRKDSGGTTFNSAQVVGQLLQAGISPAYYPAEDRTAQKVFTSWALRLVYNSGYNVFTEFYPDVLHKVRHRN